MTSTQVRRLAEAEQFLDDAKFLLEGNFENFPILTKLYHTMLYTLFALFDMVDIGSLAHADIIARFEEEYVQKGPFKKEFAEALRFMYDFTHACDCAHIKQPEDSDITGLMPIVEEFGAKVRDYLITLHQ